MSLAVGGGFRVDGGYIRSEGQGEAQNDKNNPLNSQYFQVRTGVDGDECAYSLFLYSIT